MNVLMTILSVGLMLLGASIWRFKLVHLLSNVDANQVGWTRTSALARYAGKFIILIGVVFGVLACVINHTTSRRGATISIVYTVLAIMILTMIYLGGGTLYEAVNLSE